MRLCGCARGVANAFWWRMIFSETGFHFSDHALTRAVMARLSQLGEKNNGKNPYSGSSKLFHLWDA
jgi:hypothetical protein